VARRQIFCRLGGPPRHVTDPRERAWLAGVQGQAAGRPRRVLCFFAVLSVSAHHRLVFRSRPLQQNFPVSRPSAGGERVARVPGEPLGGGCGCRTALLLLLPAPPPRQTAIGLSLWPVRRRAASRCGEELHYTVGILLLLD